MANLRSLFAYRAFTFILVWFTRLVCSASDVTPYEIGPVITSNFADPGLTQFEGVWYVFATNTNNTGEDREINIQVARSTDFKTWNLVMNPDGTQFDALTVPPPWVNTTAMDSSKIWAPDPNLLDDGRWVLYFSAAVSGDTLHHCVGAATSPSILGPYVAEPEPLFCPLAQGGAIDASGFKDWNFKSYGWGPDSTELSEGWQKWHTDNRTFSFDSAWGNNASWSQGGQGGQRYVVYKVDGNSIGHGGICGNTDAPIVPTPLLMQAVGPDGTSPQGPTYTLLQNEGVSDQGVIEAPSLVKTQNGEYVLFFSSGCYANANYTVSYATSQSLTGPYTRQAPPLLQTGDYGLFSPGGADVYFDAQHLAFHADQGTSAAVRQLYVGEISIEGTKVTI